MHVHKHKSTYTSRTLKRLPLPWQHSNRSYCQRRTKNSNHEWSFVCGQATPWNKSNMADGGEFEFCKMLISPSWMKLFAQNLVNMQHDHVKMPMRPKIELELICTRNHQSNVSNKCGSFSVIIRNTWNLDHIWYTAQETSIVAECAKFTYDENPKTAAAILNF